MRTVRYEVRWFVFSDFSQRLMRKEFDRIEDAKSFQAEQAAKHPDRTYRAYRITTEEI